MFKLISLIFFLLIAVFAFAQDERAIIDLNDQIRERVLTQNYDKRTLSRVSNQLEMVLHTLSGVPEDIDSQLVCVPRDFYGKGPFVLALESRDFSRTKLMGHIFKTLESCLEKISVIRYMMGGLHACVPRDFNDAPPYVITKITKEGTTRRKDMFKNLSDCQELLMKARVHAEATMLCTSRDFTGTAPWVKVILKNDGTSTRPSYLSFPTIESCLFN